MKACTKCGETKSLSEFFRRHDATVGSFRDSVTFLGRAAVYLETSIGPAMPERCP